jgi:hypothetical protein
MPYSARYKGVRTVAVASVVFRRDRCPESMVDDGDITIREDGFSVASASCGHRGVPIAAWPPIDAGVG